MDRDDLRLLEKVKDWCKKTRLLKPGDAVLLACSGGPDSLALVDVFLRLQPEMELRLMVAHMDHMIRGSASAGDARFVAEFCQQRKIPCEIRTVDVPSYAKQQKLSTETAARELRYAFLQEAAQQFFQAKIATAHHRDDQAETVLLHLFRGAGSQGLRGILPVSGQLIRPFLSLGKKEIEAYCAQRQLEPRIDETNADPMYRRNSIRLSLMPLLRQYNPAIEQALARSAGIVTDEYDFIRQEAEKRWPLAARAAEGEILLSREYLKKQPRAMQRELLRMAVEELQGDLKGIEFLHIEQLKFFVEAAVGGALLNLPGGLEALCRYEVIALRYRQKKDGITLENTQLFVPGMTELSGTGQIVEAEFLPAYRKPQNRQEIICDPEKLKPPFFVRKRMPGDVFAPAGLGGTKKLKAFFIDEKIERERRDGIPLFCDQTGIFWVGGCRQSEHSLVTNETTRFLRLCIVDEKKRRI